MGTQNRYYKHSGSFSIAGLIIALVIGWLSSIFLGIIYGYIIFYSPFIYINILFTIGLGVLMGTALTFGIRLGNIRNTPVMIFLGIIFGLIAVYYNWAAWLIAFSKYKLFIFSPSEIIIELKNITETGTWSLFGWTPPRISLYGFWVCEAIIIIGTTTLLINALMKETIFCEDCKEWIHEKESFTPLSPVEDHANFI